MPWPQQPLTDGVIALDRLAHDDAADIARACNDEQIARWLPVPSPYTEADAHAFLDDVGSDAAEGVALTLAVRDSRRALVGCVGLHVARCRIYEAEIGYWTAPWARRRGVAARATSLLARHAFDHLRPRRIEILVSAANGPSAGVAEKVGAWFEGIRRNGIEVRGRLDDCRVYSLVDTNADAVH